jgi:hypothetical protein
MKEKKQKPVDVMVSEAVRSQDGQSVAYNPDWGSADIRDCFLRLCSIACCPNSLFAGNYCSCTNSSNLGYYQFNGKYPDN